MFERRLHWILLLALLGAAVSPSSARAEEDARTLYERGTALFALHKFGEAAALYERAFELRPDPAILYNAAQAHRLAGNKSRALTLYESLLSLYGDKIDNRPEVTEHVKQLRVAVEAEQHAAHSPPAITKSNISTDKPKSAAAEKAAAAEREKQAAETLKQRAAAERLAAERAVAEKAAAERAAVAAAARAAEDRARAEEARAARARLAERQAAESAERARQWERDRPRRLKLSGVGLVVVGAALIVVGGAFTGLASQQNDRFLHPSDGGYSASALRLRHTYELVEIGGFAAGGALVATAVVLYAVGARESRSWSLSPALAQGGGSLIFSWRR